MPDREVSVSKLPTCSYCPAQAGYDGKTTLGPWAYMCEADFKRHGVGLGLGLGQRLVLRTRVATVVSSYPSRPEINQERSDTEGRMIHLGCGGQLKVIRILRTEDADREEYAADVTCESCGKKGKLWND